MKSRVVFRTCWEGMLFSVSKSSMLSLTSIVKNEFVMVGNRSFRVLILTVVVGAAAVVPAVMLLVDAARVVAVVPVTAIDVVNIVLVVVVVAFMVLAAVVAVGKVVVLLECGTSVEIGVILMAIEVVGVLVEVGRGVSGKGIKKVEGVSIVDSVK